MDVYKFNKDKYDYAWNCLQNELKEKSTHTLVGALKTLHAQQFDAGFIQDDLKSVIRFRLSHPKDKSRTFTIQYNPKRAQRFGGAGRKAPPAGTKAINNGCFLCKENIRWQQRGIELGYEVSLEGNEYIAWMNPFPLMPVHATIATKEHIQQTWIDSDEQKSFDKFKSIINDLLLLSNKLPGFVGFYNGIGAGASIPEHFHFQFFQKIEGMEPFPLERAAQKELLNNKNNVPLVIKDYPITAIYFYGKRHEVTNNASNIIYDWCTESFECKNATSANIIAIRDTEQPDHFHLYFVPRDKFFSRAPGMVGMIAGLEVLGELVFSTEVEKKQLDEGHIDYFFVERILSAVEPLGVNNSCTNEQLARHKKHSS